MAKKTKKTGRLFNKFIKLTFGYYLIIKYNVNGHTTKIKGIKPPYVVLPNHPGFWDPFIVSVFVPDPVHYVASDEYFRNPILKLLLGLVGAIPKTKFFSDADTVKSILAIRRLNGVIGIFPEGQRHWNGKTSELVYSTSKLLKKLKIPVVTAVFKGAFLSQPRWSRKSRRGKIHVHYDILLDKQQLSNLSVDQIHRKITMALYHDDYEYQRKNMIKFKGRRLAENLELYLFTCPHCKKTETMESHKDKFKCTNCEYTVKYNVYGFFEKVNGPLYFDNPQDWDDWQVDYLQHKIQSDDKPDEILFSDNSVILKMGKRLAPLRTIRMGELSLDKNKLYFKSIVRENYSFDLTRVNGLNIQHNDLFEFYYNNKLYRFTFKLGGVSAYKWVTAMQLSLAKELTDKTIIKKPMGGENNNESTVGIHY